MRHDGGMPATDEIEFLDASVSSQDPEVEAVVSDKSPWRWVALGCLLAACVWFVTSAGADSDPGRPVAEAAMDENEPAPLDDESDQLGSPSTAAAPINPPVFGAWPNPPTDRDPYVVRIPGPAERPVEIATERLAATTIVYVNSVGDPTVVSFQTGDVYRVDVAAIRVHETFAVETGNVVSMGEVNRSLAEGTDQAIVFHTYRDVDSPGVGTMGDDRGVGRGPELCLSDSTCRRPGLGVERLVRDGLVAERFDQQRHWAIAELLDTWEPADRWLVSPSGYRIPTPGAVIWVIAPPPQAASSTSGRI